MTAILQTLGPVSTCKAIRANWRFLKSATIQQFQSAALELQKAGFGSIISLSQLVFLKKPPGEVHEAMAANPDICDPHVYAERYRRQPSKVVNWHVRSQLVSMGLVSEKQFL